MPPIPGHDNRLLPKIATLGEANRLIRPANLHDEAFVVHVLEIFGSAGLDAQDFV